MHPGPGPAGHWRHAPWLGVDLTRGERGELAGVVTLGEGDTPLIPLPRWGTAHRLARVYAKLELANPTGSFKDRGMSVLVTLARADGVCHLVEDSSGNAGAAAAAYAARAGMACTVYAPAGAPPAKLRQIQAYGAALVPVPGHRTAVAEAARAAGAAPGSYHVAHNENPRFVAGNRTFAFELLEALPALDPGEGPWHVVIPVGGGALFCGAYEGFRVRGAAPTQLPRLHAVQASACPPIARAWAQGAIEPVPVTRRATVCGGIEIERPARGPAILEALRATGGAAVAADDPAILEERDRLARLEGIYAEPTSAAAFAGLAELARQGRIGGDELVIVAVTGTGLKDPGPPR